MSHSRSFLNAFRDAGRGVPVPAGGRAARAPPRPVRPDRAARHDSVGARGDDRASARARVACVLLARHAMLPDTGTWRRVTVDTVAALPELSAVFEVANLVRTVLYIGAAEGNLRAGVDTLLRTPGRLPQAAGGYWVRWEATDAEAELLEKRLAAFRASRGGVVPPGNRETRERSATRFRMAAAARHAA
jgi:hypothetical protein